MLNTLEKHRPETTFRQFRLSGRVSSKTISEVCGKSEGPSGDGKSKHKWDVREISTGEILSIWEYRGCPEWSAYGSEDLAARLFGKENITY